MKKQAGFSLVELVIVIIVVGLLAVAALPRFLNVTDEAKKAQIEGVAGGYATAVLSARAQWEAYGRPEKSGYNAVNYDGQDFYLSTISKDDADAVKSEGYPLAKGARKISAVSKTDCEWLMENLMQNPPKVTSVPANASKGEYAYFTKADNSQCYYYQLASASSSTSGSVSETDIESGHSFIYKLANGQVEVNIVK